MLMGFVADFRFCHVTHWFLVFFRYTYGKGVDGIAYVRFGLIDEKGNKIYLTGTEQQIEVSQSFCSGKKKKN